MVLEATMICVDNSEWMRNGDFTPNRFESQKDAVNLVTGSKINTNPQSTVGLIASAGQSVSVLCTLTGDAGRILAAVHKVQIEGNANFMAAVQVAQLALKHRNNKRQEQRIIIFVGSPIKETAKELERLGKRLKKNKVAVDVISYINENQDKLDAFINAVNNNNSHMLALLPGGISAVSEMLLSSPIITTDGGNTGGFEFGVDPNVDPELAMVLRMSMEEEEKRRAAETEKKNQEGKPKVEPSEAGIQQQSGETKTAETAPKEEAPKQEGDTEMAEATPANEEDDDLLQQALAMSVEPTSVADHPKEQPKLIKEDYKEDKKDESMEDELDEDLRLALEMSLQETSPQEEKSKVSTQEKEDLDLSQVAQDPEFMKSVLANLPGVDADDPSIKSVIESITQETKEDKDKEKDKEKK